ncbi:MAG: hypothetical protein J7M14_07360, partial [Planctomycetes bacterium]|nr:hypothetical protein [Planctomycetota bacterium]
MLRMHALMESLSANLWEFLHSIDGELTGPQKKFPRDGLVGLLRAGRPVVCRMARKLPDRGTQFLSRLDRLEEHLNASNDLDAKVKGALSNLWLFMVRKNTPIILDMSDIAKPLARKMDYLATIRDGSTGQLVNSYWLAELYASVTRKNPVPILLEPFSHEQPFCRGQNPVIIGAVRKVFQWTDRRGVLVIDRGRDARVLLDDWLDHDYRFVVRLRGDRTLLRFYSALGGLADTVETFRHGQWIPVQARLLAEQTATPHRAWRTVKRHGRVVLRFSRVGWVTVRLPGRTETLTLVVARTAGRDAPFMLLTNLPVESADDARRILRYYTCRWECEEAIRFLKSEVNLERIRTFHWTATCRLVLLA